VTDPIKTMLAGMEWFSALDAKDLDLLARSFSVEDHENGATLCKEGDHADGAFLILEGEVSVSRERGARADYIRRLQAGELFGYVALLDDRRRSATCTACGSARTAWLPESAFQLLVQSSTPAARALQRAVAAQLCSDFRRLRQELHQELHSRD